MANTRALKRQIQRQIKELQDKLKAIEMVEQMSLELGAGAPARTGEADGETLSSICEAALGPEYMDVDQILQRVRQTRSDTTKPVVRTALRRLYHSGQIDGHRKGDGPRAGWVYRKKESGTLVDMMTRVPGG